MAYPAMLLGSAGTPLGVKRQNGNTQKTYSNHYYIVCIHSDKNSQRVENVNFSE